MLSMLLALRISLVELHLKLLLLRIEHLQVRVSLRRKLALVVLHLEMLLHNFRRVVEVNRVLRLALAFVCRRLWTDDCLRDWPGQVHLRLHFLLLIYQHFA